MSGFYQAWMAARLQRLGFLRCSKPSVRMVPRCLLLIHFRDEEALREEHLRRKVIENAHRCQARLLLPPLGSPFSGFQLGLGVSHKVTACPNLAWKDCKRLVLGHILLHLPT